MKDFITLSVRIGFQFKEDVKKVENWLGKDAPSLEYRKYMVDCVGGIWKQLLPQRESDPIERFSYFLDHSKNKQPEKEYSQLKKSDNGGWQLGNANLKKGSKAWIRIGAQWIKVRVEYDGEWGYTLFTIPDNVRIHLSENLKMRWVY